MILHVTIMVTKLCDMEKDIEGYRTNDIIQHSNSMLVLWQTHIL